MLEYEWGYISLYFNSVRCTDYFTHRYKCMCHSLRGDMRVIDECYYREISLIHIYIVLTLATKKKSKKKSLHLKCIKFDELT